MVFESVSEKYQIIVLINLLAVCAQATTLIVDPNGFADYTTIQAAINAAVDGDTVIVNPGTYLENIRFYGKNIVLTSADPNNWLVVDSTVINGRSLDSVVKLSGSETQNCKLIGFTITNGKARYGGGIHGGQSYATIERCKIINNSAYHHFTDYATAYGGGIIHLDGAIINCIISNNSASATGSVYNNYNARAYGGGIAYSDAKIINCIISDNTAYAYKPNPGHQYAHGGGLCECNGSIRNCTIVNNNAVTGSSLHSCFGNIVNNIIWDDSSGHYYRSATPNYCCISGWTGSGIGNISEDPLFISGQYFLSPTSPCIDEGDPHQVIEPNETDLENDPRILGRIDMGVDEVFVSDSAALSVFYNNIYLQTGVEQTTDDSFALEIINYGAYALNWHIEMPNDCNWLDIFPFSGQAAAFDTNQAVLYIDHNHIDYGSYQHEFQVVDPNAIGSPQVVTVNLDVLGPALHVEPQSLLLERLLSNANTVSGALSITNSGYDYLNWQIDVPNDCNWLDVEPLSGQTSTEANVVIVTANPTGLGLGFYNTQLTVSDPNADNSPQIIPVTLHIYSPGKLYVPQEYETIQAAVDAANDGEEIIMAPGAYNQTDTIMIEEKAITIRSTNPDDPRIVASTVIKDHGFYIRQIDTNEISIEGIHLMGNPLIGDPYNYSFYGVSGYDSRVNIYNCAIEDYTCGIQLRYCDANIIGCKIERGVISSSDRVWQNGVWLEYSSVNLINCLIAGNHSLGIHIAYASDVNILNCTIADTKAYYDFYGTLEAAVALRCFGSIANLTNCILWNNHDANGFEIYVEDVYEYMDSVVNLSYCNVDGGEYYTYVGTGGQINWGPGNTSTDPCFVRPGYYSYIDKSPADLDISGFVDFVDYAILAAAWGSIPNSPRWNPLCDLSNPPDGMINFHDAVVLMDDWLYESDPNGRFWVDGDYHLKSRGGSWQTSQYIGLDPTGDGFIDLTDFAAAAALWDYKAWTYFHPYYPIIYDGKCASADFDYSGIVDYEDLAILLDDYLYEYELGQWMLDDSTSPCIDAGDPNWPVGSEPDPNGARVNMGAYGGTAEASMSF